MKKASLKIVICLLFVLALGSVLVACNKNTAAHYDFRVTFNYNVGTPGLDDSLTKSDVQEQYVGAFNNGLVSIRPGYSAEKFPETSIAGYYIEGWYVAKTDEDGEVLKDEKGFVLLDRAWNFKTDRVTDDITLYANLVKQATLSFVDRKTGIVADTVFMGKPGAKRTKPSSSGAPKKEGYTLFTVKSEAKYYVDATEDAAEFKWPYVFTTEDDVLYVDFVEGENWTFVTTPEEFVTAMNGGRNIYLMNDIDFTEKTSYWAAGVFYNGVLNGRDYKVIGLKRDLLASRRDYEIKGGIFGTIGAAAHIYDVTFENCTVTYDVSNGTPVGWSVGLFAWEAKEGAKIENVTVTGTLSYYSANGGVKASAWIAVDATKADDINNVDFTGVEVTVITDEAE